MRLARWHRPTGSQLFRLPVRCGDTGMAAGEIAGRPGVPNSSLSFHLAHLERSGLIGRTGPLADSTAPTMPR